MFRLTGENKDDVARLARNFCECIVPGRHAKSRQLVHLARLMHDYPVKRGDLQWLENERQPDPRHCI